MTMLRACRLFLPVMAILGLASCSDRMPSRPAVDEGPGPPPPGTGAPLDSLLAANQTRWEASGISWYRYRFRWECYCIPEVVRTVDITVIHRTIISVVDAETGVAVNPEEAARYRTIDGLFDFVREGIDYPAASIQAGFDPGLGYPSRAYVDYIAGMADEEMGFRVFSLTPFKR